MMGVGELFYIFTWFVNTPGRGKEEVGGERGGRGRRGGGERWGGGGQKIGLGRSFPITNSMHIILHLVIVVIIYYIIYNIVVIIIVVSSCNYTFALLIKREWAYEFFLYEWQ